MHRTKFKPMKIRKPMFDAPIQDEVELAFQSKKLLKRLSSPPTKKELLDISSACLLYTSPSPRDRG